VKYPTKKQVEDAGKVQLAKWYRFLPSPGMNYINEDNFHDKLIEEKQVLDYIIERFGDLGGWDPVLSKLVGWDS